MIELQAGRLRCQVEPQPGGCITGLWLGDAPVPRTTPTEQRTTARLSSCYALVPFSNRIGQASLVWEGTQHPLVRNNGDEPHAIHGVGWQRPWSVLDEDASSVLLSYEHAADASWPFAFDCSHALRLKPDALEMTLALTNQSPQSAPAGLAGTSSSSSGRAATSHSRRRWEMGEDKLPMGRSASRGIDADCATVDVDHSYDGWDGEVRLRDDLMQVSVRSGLTRLVVFPNASRDVVAIERVSHVSNAVQPVASGARAEDLGLATLQPGGTMMAQITIEAEAVR